MTRRRRGSTAVLRAVATYTQGADVHVPRQLHRFLAAVAARTRPRGMDWSPLVFRMTIRFGDDALAGRGGSRAPRRRR